MYVPAQFAGADQHAIEVMRAHGFALLVSCTPDGDPFATHCPLVASADGRTLRGHIARANLHWQAWERDARILAVFSGPHAYISPTLYASRQSVPTWNYIAVHATGSVRCLHAVEDKRAVLDALIAATEPEHAAQWAAQSPQFANGLMEAIVGFEIAVERIEAKFKLSQNRSAGDRATIAAAMRAGGDDARALADWMARLGLTG